jgi:hypothetical protein
MEVSNEVEAPKLYSWEKRNWHSFGGWVGCRVDSDSEGKRNKFLGLTGHVTSIFSSSKHTEIGASKH